MTTCSMKSLLSDSFAGEWGSETGDVLTPVLRTANFNDDGSLDYDSPAYRCIPEKKVQAKRMRRGDIILEKSGGTPNRPVGIMAYYDSDAEALCSNFNHILRFDGSSVNPYFMFHQLRWLRERGAFAPYTRKTTGLQNLQMKAFVDLELTVPPRAEQDKAAIAIRAINAERNELKGHFKRLDELVKSRFVEMFGEVSETNELQELILPKTKISYGIVQPGPEGTGNMGVLRPVDIVDGRLSLEGVKRIDRSIGDSYKRTELIGDEVLTVVRGATGQTVRSTPEAAGMNVTRGIAVIRYNADVVDPDFLVACMNSDDGQRYISEHTQGATLQQINITDLKVMPIPKVSLKLQQEFAAFVQQVDKLEFETQQAIDKLQMLYDSLAQEYFGSE